MAEIVDAVGDKIDVICEGGFQRGTHMLKALSLGAKACAGGRLYLYALAAAGQDFTGGRYDGAGSKGAYDANPTGFSGSS